MQPCASDARLRTHPPAAQGQFVCEYVGEVIRREEARRREKEYEKLGLYYLHDVHGSDAQGGLDAYTIDPTKCGNVGRMFNHSCEPSVTTIEFAMQYDREQAGDAATQFPKVPRVCFFALKDIEPWEELTLDYSPGRSGAELKKTIPCCCGTNSCKGWIF